MDPKEVLRQYLLPGRVQKLPEKLQLLAAPLAGRKYQKCVAFLDGAGLLQDAARQLLDLPNREDFGISYGLRDGKYRNLGCMTRDYVFFAGNGIGLPCREITRLEVGVIEADAGGDGYVLELSAPGFDQVWAVSFRYRQDAVRIRDAIAARMGNL